MGGAMLKGWQNDPHLDAEIYVIDPLIGNRDSESNCYYCADATHLPEGYNPDLVILAVKPQMMAEALAQTGFLGDEQTCWLSIAAGLSTQRISMMLGRSARILRAMPNTPAAIGKGITALFSCADVPIDMVKLSRQLLAACGEVVMLEDEGLMNAITALSGSGPAYVFLLVEAMAEAGNKLGLDAQLSMQLARQTVIGAGALMEQDSLPAQTLRQNVTSEGGTTAAALAVLMGETSLQAIFDNALKAAADRAVELDSANG